MLCVPPFITRDWVDPFAIDRPTSGGHATEVLGHRPPKLRQGVEQAVQRIESRKAEW